MSDIAGGRDRDPGGVFSGERVGNDRIQIRKGHGILTLGVGSRI